MKLDAAFVRYLQPDDCRVLTAVEMGSKNHEVVPVQLIGSIAKIRPGGVKKILSELAKHSLVSKEAGVSYEGYRLTYAGYDYLALHTFAQRNTVTHVGHQIGVGKESDIHLVEGRLEEEGILEQRILKLQRLGRTSFRTVRTNRDYVGNGRMMKHSSWMYLSRRAAQKEWSFLQALWDRGFPVPRPIDQSRHAIVMEWIDGIPFGQVHREDLVDDDEVADLYAALIRLLLRLAAHGLIHGDFNEFNLIYAPKRTDRMVLIDFPQMVSTSHPNARELFQRDVQCIVDFFTRRFNFIPQEIPDFDRDVRTTERIDAELCASGHLNASNTDSSGEDADDATEDDDSSSQEDSENDIEDDEVSSEEDDESGAIFN